MNSAKYQDTTSTHKNQMLLFAFDLHLLGYLVLKKKKTKNSKCWLEFGGTRTLVRFWWKCKMIHPLQKTVWYPDMEPQIHYAR